MKLQEKLKQDLSAAIKTRDEERKKALRVVIGEFGRMDHKSLSDEEVIRVIRKLRKAESELRRQTGTDIESPYMEILGSYLPQMAGEAEIEAWIGENIDFSTLRSKMQAMGPIMKHFGAGVDGNLVKAILQRL